MTRLLDCVYAQIPRQLRGRLDVVVTSDPYYLRTEVVIAGKDGTLYPSGPIEVTLDRGRFVDCKLPDWFVGHMCSIPVDHDRLAAQLWDSLNDVSDATTFQR